MSGLLVVFRYLGGLFTPCFLAGWGGCMFFFWRKVIFALAGFRFVGAKRKVCLSVLQIYPFAFFFFAFFSFFSLDSISF